MLVNARRLLCLANFYFHYSFLHFFFHNLVDLLRIEEFEVINRMELHNCKLKFSLFFYKTCFFFIIATYSNEMQPADDDVQEVKLQNSTQMHEDNTRLNVGKW